MSRKTSNRTSLTKRKRTKQFDSAIAIRTPGQQQFAQIILRILRRILR